jgi:transposase-like protein
MPRPCCVCTDPRREQIDGQVATGRSIPKIAGEFGIPESNLYRHRKDHLNTAAAIARSGPAGAISVIETLQERDKELCGVLGMAVTRGHTGAAIAAINQRIRVALEIANLRGEIQPQEKRVVHVHVDRSAAARMATTYLEHERLTAGGTNAK